MGLDWPNFERKVAFGYRMARGWTLIVRWSGLHIRQFVAFSVGYSKGQAF